MKGSLSEMYRHYAPMLDEYFNKKSFDTVQLRVVGDTQEETLKKAYTRDARLELLQEILEDFKYDKTS